MSAAARPLSGRKIMVTRAPGQAHELSSLLRGLGAEVVQAPLIAIEPVVDRQASRALSHLDRYHYLLLTSANAARYLSRVAAQVGAELGVGEGGRPEVFAVGPATARATRAMGLVCQQLPARFTADSLVDTLVERGIRGERILLPRSERAPGDVPARLRREGAIVDTLIVYRTVAHPDASTRLPGLIRSGLDMVTFTSGSTVESYAALARRHREAAGPKFACIGPVTAEAASRAGLVPAVVAEVHTAAGLASAVAEYYAAVRSV